MALRLTLHFDLANFPTRRCRCSRNRPPTPRQPGPLGPPTPPTLSQPRTISWSATGRPPSAHSYPLLRRLPRAASLARLGRQSAPAHCSGRRGRLLLRRPCWSVSVGSYRPCPTHGTAAHGQGCQQEGSAGSSPVVASAASRRIAACSAARPVACSGALLRSAWPSPVPSAVLVGVGRRLSTLSCSEAAQATRTEWRRGGSEGCHGHRSSRSAAAAAQSPAVSRRTCTSESRVLVRCIVRARVHAPALMERPRQTPRRWSATGPA